MGYLVLKAPLGIEGLVAGLHRRDNLGNHPGLIKVVKEKLETLDQMDVQVGRILYK
jgi:hypothetical protein